MQCSFLLYTGGSGPWVSETKAEVRPWHMLLGSLHLFLQLILFSVGACFSSLRSALSVRLRMPGSPASFLLPVGT